MYYDKIMSHTDLEHPPTSEIHKQLDRDESCKDKHYKLGITKINKVARRMVSNNERIKYFNQHKDDYLKSPEYLQCISGNKNKKISTFGVPPPFPPTSNKIATPTYSIEDFYGRVTIWVPYIISIIVSGVILILLTMMRPNMIIPVIILVILVQVIFSGMMVSRIKKKYGKILNWSGGGRTGAKRMLTSINRVLLFIQPGVPVWLWMNFY